MFADIAYALGRAPQNAESGQGGNFLVSFLPLIFIFAIFYFLLKKGERS